MAATVIDQLLVTLELNAKQFESGRKVVSQQLDQTRKEGDKTAKEMQEAGKKAADFFSELRKSALAFFAVLTAGRGMASFTRDVVASGAQLDRLAKNLNTSASTLSQWGNATELSGGSAAAFQGTLANLSSEITNLKMTGQSSLSPFLQRFGIQIMDANRHALPFTSILLQMSDALRSVPDRADAANIGKMMGLDEGTINLLLKGRGDIQAMLKEQRNGIALTDEQAKKARLAQEQWIKTKQQMESVGRELVIKLLPSLLKLAELFKQVAEVAVPILVQLVDLLQQLDHATDGWSTKLLFVLGIFRLLGGPGIVAGLLRIAGAITGIGSAAGASGSVLGTLLSRLAGVARFGGAVGLALHSEELNQGENEFNASRLQAWAARREAAAAASAGGVGNLPGGSSGPRGLRNNNPGNLEFHGQAGAVLESGVKDPRFARFGSMAQGVTALAKQLMLYGSRGINSIRAIVHKYAPKGENKVQAYIADLMRSTGFGADQALNLSDSATLASMMNGISKHEGSGALNGGLLASGIAAAKSRYHGASGGNSTVSIGEVKVYTQATDAKGIARDMRAELVAQSNNGMR